MKVTKHSKKRVKERCGLSKNATEDMAAKALSDGIRHNETSGNLHKYITKLFFGNNNVGDNIIIYNRYVYIFKGTLLITVFSLPSSLNKYEDAIKEKRRKTAETKTDQ